MYGYELYEPSGEIVREPQAELPVAIRPARATVRITVQKGMFTIHGRDQRPLDKIVAKANVAGRAAVRLKRLIIPASSKPNLLRELYKAGISAAALFPDLDGLARDIVYRYSPTYLLDALPSEEGSRIDEGSSEPIDSAPMETSDSADMSTAAPVGGPSSAAASAPAAPLPVPARSGPAR